MVDMFRGSQFAREIVDEALAMKPRPQVIWMQFTVRDDAAAAKAEAAGLKVVMNRCPKIEYGRLSSEIGWIGVNSRTLSSKKAPLLGKGVQRMSLNRSTTRRIHRRGDPSGAKGGRRKLSNRLPSRPFLAFFPICLNVF